MSEAQSARCVIRASIDFFSYLSEGNESLLTGDITPLNISNVSVPNTTEEWPGTDDTRLLRLKKKFLARGGAPLLTIDAHLALLCVLELRSECGLRGIRPSGLFGSTVVSALCTRGILNNMEVDLDMNKCSEDAQDNNVENISSVRTEFIMHCFKQLGANRSPTLYRLAALWRYSLHEVRIMHLSALLDLYLDNLVDEMIPQVCLILSIYPFLFKFINCLYRLLIFTLLLTVSRRKFAVA